MGLSHDVCSDADKLADEIWSDPFGDKDEIATAIRRGFAVHDEQHAKALGFWNAQAEWSRATFGSDAERGPIGPLKHLSKEVNEAIEAIKAGICPREEIVDCLFLTFDAARRSGMTFDEFFAMCFEKLAVNKARAWNKPMADEPVEHVRDA